MDYKVVMPRLSDSMNEGMLVAWKIQPGMQVKNGDVIAEVESDKAVMEIQTFKSGTVTSLLVEAGTVVPVGNAIAVINTEASAASAADRTDIEKKSTLETQPVEHEQKQEEPEPRKPTPVKQKVAASQNIVDIVIDQDIPAARPSSFSQGDASPRARAEAAKHGLDIEQLQKKDAMPIPAHYEDVKRYYLERYFTPKALKLIAKYHLSTDLFEAGKKHDAYEVQQYIEAHEIPLPQQLDITKRAMITMLEEAAKKPVYHMNDHLDIKLFTQYESHHAITTVWLIKLFGEAMMRHRDFRMTLKDDTFQIWPDANISLAMAQGELLYMPVFKRVNKKSITEIAAELKSYKAKLKARRLSKDELSGSTFGISNLGITGIASFDAMINKDDCAIAALGTAKDAKISVTLTVDHRLVNGFQAAQFMQTLKALATDALFFKEISK